MRVLYYHQHFSTPDGAAGTRSYEMARRLVEAGHEVTMVCGTYGVGMSGLSGPFVKRRRTGSVDGIEVIELELPYHNKHGFLKRSWTFLRFAWRSVGIAMSRDYDLVFATSTPLTAAIPGIVARVLRRKRFVFEVRDLWPELPRAMGVIKNPVVLWMLGVLERTAYKAAHGCIGLSPGICEGIRRFGKPEHLVRMVPNGCDVAFFDSIPRGTRPEGVADSDCLAVFTGAHGLANGLDAVLDAAAILKKRGREDIKLLFVGDGMKKQELVARAQSDGLTNCIFQAPMPKRDLVALLKVSNVGLMILANVPAFYYGTSPNKFFDYLSCGVPIVNNYPGWLADMITASSCGHAVPPDEPGLLADALEQLADQEEQRAVMSSHAAQLAQQFDREVLGRHFVSALESFAHPASHAAQQARTEEVR